MKINKEGFTLIELLGVVIILSLLVTLIFPSIINSIKNSSNESDELNKQIIYSQADIYIKDNLNNYTVSNGTTFCISLNDLVDSNYIKSPIQLGDYEDITDIYSVKVTYNNSYNYELIENDLCPEPTFVAKKVATTGIVPQLDSNGNFLPGSEFKIKVSEEIGYLTFFVLGNEEQYTNLIAEQNITIDGNFTSNPQDNDEWYVTQSNSYDNRYGPQTAYVYLNQATSKWINIPVIENFKYEDVAHKVNPSYGYQSIVTALNNTTGKYITTITPFSSDYGDPVTYEDMRARLPYMSEITTNTSCATSNGSCPLWMVNYLRSSSYYSTEDGKVNSIGIIFGYWLLDSYSGNIHRARYIYSDGSILNHNTNIATYGIRPVITIPKSELIRAM